MTKSIAIHLSHIIYWTQIQSPVCNRNELGSSSYGTYILVEEKDNKLINVCIMKCHAEISVMKKIKQDKGIESDGWEGRVNYVG